MPWAGDFGSRPPTAIDQDPRDPNAIATFNDERITVAAATQAREPHAGAGALATIGSATKN